MRAKLVRDHCPAVIEDECDPASTDAEYQMALLLKLHEEAQEIAADACNPEEYADLLEVMLALADNNGVDGAEILKALVTKRERKGGFEEGQIWTEGGAPPLKPAPITVEHHFHYKCPTPEDFGFGRDFASSCKQITASVHALPAWLTWAMKRDG